MQRNFLEFHSLPFEAAVAVIDRACELAEHWNNRTMPQSLTGKRIALVVDDAGWRNTTAIELGVSAMGGLCIKAAVKFDGREAVSDLAGYLANWFDLVVIRTRNFAVLKEFAAEIDIPVINARTASNHPCEILGDLAYLRSLRRRFEGLKVVGIAPDANILRSWFEATKSLPINVVQVYPQRWHVADQALLSLRTSTSTDLREAFDADVIVTDCWPHGAKHDDLVPYRVSAGLLNRARKDLIFLPCPPVTRGQEVTADAMLHPTCMSRPAKAFLLHAQNALMEYLTSPKSPADDKYGVPPV